MCSGLSGFRMVKKVQKVLRSSFRLEVTKISPMDSYTNFNFLVRSHAIGENSEESTPYVVKIYNTKSENFFDNAKFQHVMMYHLQQNDFSCSTPLQTEDGDTYVRYQEGETEYLLQVLTFVPGQSVNAVKINVVDLRNICFDVGQMLGKLHEATSTIQFGFSTRTTEFGWLPHNALNFFKKISYITDKEVGTIIAKYKLSYERNFLPRLEDLRTGFIHSDFSDTNVLIKKTELDFWMYSGIIDFEHCHFGYLVGELGVSVAYFMMKSASVPNSDIIASSAEQIRGYEAVNPLTKAEKEVLLDVVTGRLCSSYISASYQAHLHRENEKYIFISAKNIPLVFQAMEEAGREEILNVWFGNDH